MGEGGESAISVEMNNRREIRWLRERGTGQKKGFRSGDGEGNP